MSKTSITIGAIVCILIGITVGYVAWHRNQTAGSSPSGSTFTTSKFAGIAINLANPGAAGTSSSILNTDTNDRYVSTWKLGCEKVGTSQTAYTGTGLANLQISVGTTTTFAPATFNYNQAIALNASIPTTTPNLLVSSSTVLTATGTLSVIWPAQTYMTFYFNATNTAQCTVGVDYFGS